MLGILPSFFSVLVYVVFLYLEGKAHSAFRIFKAVEYEHTSLNSVMADCGPVIVKV